MWSIELFSCAFLCLASARAQYNSPKGALPVVDLGYRLQRASAFNDTAQFYNFSNIRYASPPLAKLRFAAPESPVDDRSVVYDGLKEGRICPQATSAGSAMTPSFLANYYLGTPLNESSVITPPSDLSKFPVPKQDPRSSEDCLFLDVFSPKSVFDKAGKGPGAPVLVWIYGGGYNSGEKAGSGTPNGLFVRGKQDLVFVALNYRLGAFGWLSGPAFQAEGAANAGLLDQKLALEWVKKNIHLFGGDCNRVTVIGESAGGGSIMHHITANDGTGKQPSLFQQAILQSPGWAPQTSKSAEDKIYRRFLDLANVTTLADARKLPTEAVIRANYIQNFFDGGGSGLLYGPAVDGGYVADLPGVQLSKGHFDKSVKVMVGQNGNEGLLFTNFFIRNDTAFVKFVQSFLPNAKPPVIDYITKTLYPPVFDGSSGYKTQIDRTALFISEAAFSCNVNYLGRAYGNKTYDYMFDVPPPLHGLDVGYTFFDSNSTAQGKAAPTPSKDTDPVTLLRSFLAVQNVTVAVTLQNIITSFAQNKKPNNADGLIPKFDQYGPNANVVDLGVNGFSQVKDKNANDRCLWWQKALYA